MTKYRTTDKEQRENNAIVLGFSYCDIQNITRYLRPNAYTCGVYGWRADFYEMEGYTISTGYSPLRYIMKTNMKDINVYNNEKAKILQKELEKLEEKLKNNAYKWQFNGSWHYCQKKVMQILSRIEKKACKIANEKSNDVRIKMKG
jgi:hypothetical protein